MLNIFHQVFAPVLRGLATLVLLSGMLQAAAPKGWFIAGNRAGAYDSGIDVVTYNGHPSAFLKSNQPRVQGFGTLMQSFRPGHYLGKRVRFSAFVKTEGAKEWAGLWMRVDKGTQTAATKWQKYEVVLDVPQDATSISFGVLLSGSGEVWFNSAKFEAVGPTVLPTSGDVILTPDEPINLDLEE